MVVFSVPADLLSEARVWLDHVVVALGREKQPSEKYWIPALARKGLARPE